MSRTADWPSPSKRSTHPPAARWHHGRVDLDAGAGLLHRLTSYTPDYDWDKPVDDPRVRQDFVSMDPGTRPPQFKTYPAGLPAVALPRDLPDPGGSATSVLAGVPAAPAPLDAAQLGRVLFLGAGIVRYMVRDDRTMYFRASGSAGGRFPLEIYVCTRNVAGVPDGVHWYHAVAHALVQIGPPARGDVTTLVVTGLPWRTGWKYAERGFRHIYWDGGTLLSQLWAASDSAGLQPRLRTLFPDARVTDLVGADAVHEFPIALLSFGDGTPAIGATGPAAQGEFPEYEFPLVTTAQRAGDRDVLGEPWPSAPALADHPDSPSLNEVILRRGSQRLMDRTKTLPREFLTWSMTAALRGITVPHWVAVHGVDGVAPGLYRWPDLQTPIRSGDLREEFERLCLAQQLGADAAFVAVSAIPLSQLDDRSYREAQLAAGIVEGRLHLAAYALGAGASGMTFIDSEMPHMLGGTDLATLLFTCVGVPEYASRRGGGPGAPAQFRMVQPRINE
jgi:SagB-type dehydrogenase family enzyme